MNTLGKIFAYLHVISVYRNGDTYGFVWHWWNPISWVFGPLAFIALAFFEGVPTAIKNKHDVGFGIDPYFVSNRDQLEWIRRKK